LPELGSFTTLCAYVVGMVGFGRNIVVVWVFDEFVKIWWGLGIWVAGGVGLSLCGS
jgi:hypothetical protein